MMEDKNANSIISVCEVDHSPLWANVLPEDLSLKSFINEDLLNKPRQEMSTYYRINGAIYIVKVDYLMSKENIYGDKSFAFVMDKTKSIDIDDEFDFKMAEQMIQK